MLPSEDARAQFAGLKARRQRPTKGASPKRFGYQASTLDPVIVSRRESPSLPNYSWIGLHDEHTDHISERMDRLEARLCKEVNELRLSISTIANVARSLAVVDDVDDEIIDATLWDRATASDAALGDIILALDLIGERESIPDGADWGSIATKHLTSSSHAARAAAARAIPVILSDKEAKVLLTDALATEQHLYVIAAIKGSLFGLT